MTAESNWNTIRTDVEAWFKRFADQHSCKCPSFTQEDLRQIQDAIRTSERALSRKIDKIGKLMSVSVDQLDADIQTLIAGYQAVVAANVQLQAALDAADATKAAAVADAIAAEDSDAQAKIDAADAVVAAANAPAAPPADGGDTPAS